MTLYTLFYSYASPTQEHGTESGGSFIFRSEKPQVEVIKQAWSWVEGRERLPEMFGKFYCLQLSEFTPPEIIDGQLTGAGHGFIFYEWKFDWPMANRQREVDSGNDI